MSNDASPPQQVENVPCKGLEEAVVTLRPWGGQPGMGTDQNEPRMNTDGHGWDDADQAGALQR